MWYYVLMSKDLLARREKAGDSFNKLVKQREAKVEEITNLDAELNRLQGEYRLINDLLDKAEEALSVSTKADKLDASKVKGA